jgi:polyisoprenoid-binding protein YceI
LARYCVLLALVLWCVACDADPAKGKAQAAVTEPSPSSAERPIPGAKRFDFDEASSSIEFVGAKVTGRHAGKFGDFQGTIQLVPADLTKSSVSLSIEAASLTSDDAKLTKHLKSPDFFDVARFPKARFTSTSIVPGGADSATHTITGNLELRGVTKQVTFPAHITAMAEVVEATAEFSINRKDFGVAYSGMAGDLIRDQVLLMIKLRATRR